MSHPSDYRHEGQDDWRDDGHNNRPREQLDPVRLAVQIKQWGRELGFEQVGIADTDLGDYEKRLDAWLAEGHQGEMAWMGAHGRKRSRPELLHEGTRSVIVVRLDYLPADATPVETLLELPEKACISRYAVGRDYHKVLRSRLKHLTQRIETETGPFGNRVFTDSAPVMEKPLAEKAGLGWIGKHTNLLNRHAGSWFFLGEIYTDLNLPADQPVRDHCGSCRRCIDVCPTQAIIGPYKLDARRCISYLTIELKGAIPEEFRKPMGNRIYGCDDCQMVCPWNRYAQFSQVDDFTPRQDLDAADLVDLFAWDEATFLARTEGTAIRRIGHERWLRNIAVGLGNAPTTPAVTDALKSRLDHASEIVREHVAWAFAEHG